MRRREALSCGMSNRIARKNAQSLVEVFKEMIRSGGATATHNSYRVYSAWNAVSGAERYTIKRFFRDGKLYITLSSSVLASQLAMQAPYLIEKMNDILASDELLIASGDGRLSEVKQLIIR